MKGPTTLAAWHARPAVAPDPRKLVVPSLMASTSLAHARAMAWGAAGPGTEALFRLVRVLGRQAAREAFRDTPAAAATANTTGAP
jgi:hypothetical protein